MAVYSDHAKSRKASPYFGSRYSVTNDIGCRQHWPDADNVRIVEKSLCGYRQGSATGGWDVTETLGMIPRQWNVIGNPPHG